MMNGSFVGWFDEWSRFINESLILHNMWMEMHFATKYCECSFCKTSGLKNVLH